MGDRYAIWGCSGHTKVLTSLIRRIGGTVVAVFDRRELPSISPGIPFFHGVDGFKRWLAIEHSVENVVGSVAIGGAAGRDRLEIQELFRQAGMQLTPLVHPAASVCETATLGAGTQVLSHAVVAADCSLGEACIINHNSTVDHETKLGRGVHVGPGATICGCVEIGENVFIGSGAIVLPRIAIYDNAVIGAGAVVTKDVPLGATIVGNPGRPYNDRS